MPKHKTNPEGVQLLMDKYIRAALDRVAEEMRKAPDEYSRAKLRRELRRWFEPIMSQKARRKRAKDSPCQKPRRKAT
jgi:fructose-1,6-bisphosphatase